MLNRQKPQKPKITGIIHKYRTQINVNDFICYEFNIVPIFCKCNYNFPSSAIIYSLSNCLFVFLCILYVSQIVKNGPASKVDLREGDIIISIDDKELNTMNDLREYIYSKKPNDVVTLQISRGKINKNISITLR